MFIELHIIQNFAPSNLNRDDTGNPKDAEFGGVRRARISSQCFKRAIRSAPIFAETTGVDIGTRTRWVSRLLREALEPYGKSADEIQSVLGRFVPAYLSKFDSKFKPAEDAVDTKRTAVLLYLSQDEVAVMAEALLADWSEFLPEKSNTYTSVVRDLIKLQRNFTSAPDIALFGRMLAEKPDLNIDAACQVAHALSTHRVTMEMDFFTAVDDLTAGTEETGAGMMGFTGFDSACFYRYARLDWDLLYQNLDKDTGLARRTVEAFLRAAVEAVPTGKQNTFAAHNPPSLVMAAVREGGFAWNLANAFEKPVYTRRDSGLVSPSVEALDNYWNRLVTIYGTESMKTVTSLALQQELSMPTLAETLSPNLENWVASVMEALPEQEN